MANPWTAITIQSAHLPDAQVIFTRLGYIDIQHLASRITGRVLMATALMDTVCPPSTQFAAYNKIVSPKVSRIGRNPAKVIVRKPAEVIV